jgi:hypothetical protein
MPMDDLDLAARYGLLLLPRPTPGGVSLSGRVLRYDPALPQARRAELVAAILAALSAEPRA